MLESMKKVLESVLSKGIYDLVKYLFLLILAGITGLITHALSVNNKYLISYAIVIAIISAASVTLLALVTYIKFSPIHNFYLDTDFNYVILEKHIIYEYKSSEDIIYTKKYKLKIRKSIDRFFDKYNWTGGNMPIIISLDKHHKIIQTTRRDSYQQYEVHFGRKAKKGEILDLTLIFYLTDKEKKSTPSLSTTIVEPTNHLILTLKINSTYRTDSVVYEKFPLTDNRLSLESKNYDFSSTGEVEIKIDDPKMLLVYSLSWENPESQNN